MKYSIAFIPAFAATGMAFPLFHWAREVPEMATVGYVQPTSVPSYVPTHRPSGHFTAPAAGATGLPGHGPHSPHRPHGSASTGFAPSGTAPGSTGFGTGTGYPARPTSTGIWPPPVPGVSSTVGVPVINTPAPDASSAMGPPIINPSAPAGSSAGAPSVINTSFGGSEAPNGQYPTGIPPAPTETAPAGVSSGIPSEAPNGQYPTGIPPAPVETAPAGVSSGIPSGAVSTPVVGIPTSTLGGYVPSAATSIPGAQSTGPLFPYFPSGSSGFATGTAPIATGTAPIPTGTTPLGTATSIPFPPVATGTGSPFPPIATGTGVPFPPIATGTGVPSPPIETLPTPGYPTAISNEAPFATSVVVGSPTTLETSPAASSAAYRTVYEVSGKPVVPVETHQAGYTMKPAPTYV